jgi:hypothetical protein
MSAPRPRWTQGKNLSQPDRRDQSLYALAVHALARRRNRRTHIRHPVPFAAAFRAAAPYVNSLANRHRFKRLLGLASAKCVALAHGSREARKAFFARTVSRLGLSYRRIIRSRRYSTATIILQHLEWGSYLMRAFIMAIGFALAVCDGEVPMGAGISGQ